MTLYFITGNKNKFAEAKAIIPEIEQLEIDLSEIQDIDSHKIIKAKLIDALNHKEGSFIVEDVSLSLECLNGLPGPLIKWFLMKIGKEGIAELAEKLGNNNAEAKAIIGYAKSKSGIQFFEGSVKGKIVRPAGESGFGFDPIFKPEGSNKTYAEMPVEEKNKISHRRLALNKLKEFLEQT